MTIQQCYQQLCGDYADVLRRLPSDALVERFSVKFLEDDSYPSLVQAMAQGNCEAAFRAAHTLKGVSANLGFTQLCASASQLTELLRGVTGEIPPDAAERMNQVRQDYQMTTDALRAFQAERSK